MSRRTPMDAFSAAAASLVSTGDATSIVAQLLADAGELLSADSVGLLLADDDDRFELLTATSHAASALEVLQTQQQEGPCVDCIRQGVQVHESDPDRLADRWPTIGPAILAAGYRGVSAIPVRWRDRNIGGVNFFMEDARVMSPADVELAQAFADLTSVIILGARELTADEVLRGIRDALSSRIIVEQAKGVLAHTHGLDMEQAYRVLVEHSQLSGRGLVSTAWLVVNKAAEGHAPL